MDKYELNIKEDKIKKHAEKKDYAAAVKIADTIDWSKIKNIKMLTLVSQVYEKAKNYTEAKNVLLFAYERVPMGRRMLYKLTELCVKEGKIEEAESYFEEFQRIAPNDISRLLLAYQIESAKGSSLDQLITILELYRKNEFEEQWAYELAFLYHQAGRVQECVQICNEIILWFSVGTYVDKALNLKMQYEPLTPSEQEKLVNKKKFEDRVRAVEREFEKREYRGIREDDGEIIEQRRKKEQMQEAAMTSEPAADETSSSEEIYREEAAEEVEVFEQEPLFADAPETKSVSDKVISFSSARSSESADAVSEITSDIMEETSAAVEKMFFAEEEFSKKEPQVEPLPVRNQKESPEKAAVSERALEAEETGEALADEIFDMQASLAQAVQEAEKEPELLTPPAMDEADLFGQTKEVVEETRKALKQETGEAPALAEGEEKTPEEEEVPEGGSALAEEEEKMPEEEGVPEGGPALAEEEEKTPEEEVPEGGPALAEEEEKTPEEEGVPEGEPALAEEEEEVPEGEPALAEGEEKTPEEEIAKEAPALREETPEEKEGEVISENQTAPDESPVVFEAKPAALEEETETSAEFEITCVVVEAEPGKERIPFAVEKLKKTHEVLGSSATQVAKISGTKLSVKGVHNTFRRLAGRDLIVDDAAELTHEAVAELVEEMKRPQGALVLILVDTSERMDELLLSNPELDQLCVYLEEGGQMDIDEFVACANEYAKDEECVIDEMANLAIYAVAERLRDDGTELTEEAAKKLVDGAINRAEHRGIKGLFGSKYDKEGYLILKEQYFRNL